MTQSRKSEKGLVVCPHCDGYGTEPGAIPVKSMLGKPLCSVCDGDGKVTKAEAARYDRLDD